MYSKTDTGIGNPETPSERSVKKVLEALLAASHRNEASENAFTKRVLLMSRKKTLIQAYQFTQKQHLKKGVDDLLEVAKDEVRRSLENIKENLECLR